MIDIWESLIVVSGITRYDCPSDITYLLCENF